MRIPLPNGDYTDCYEWPGDCPVTVVPSTDSLALEAEIVALKKNMAQLTELTIGICRALKIDVAAAAIKAAKPPDTFDERSDNDE